MILLFQLRGDSFVSFDSLSSNFLGTFAILFYGRWLIDVYFLIDCEHREHLEQI